MAETVKHLPRLALVTPFLDKSYGTERIAVEWITQLAGKFEIHIYSQHVEDLDLSRVTWHRIPKLPGAHLFSFLWWFVANHIWRAWDRRFRNLRYDLVFSPGVNCLDADVVSVHIVFTKYYRDHRRQSCLRANPLRAWPRALHRMLYYQLVTALERRVYADPDVTLIAMSQRTILELQKSLGNCSTFRILHVGLDHAIFNTANRLALRPEARRTLGLSDGRFTLLLVGNDWRNKGLPVLLDALGQIPELPVDLVVVSREELAEARAAVLERFLANTVHFCPPRKDVEFYYAAADAYVGPSLEDTFALPPAEAMACGLPVIVSGEAGVSEIVTDGVNGLILKDPRDAQALATMIRSLCQNAELRDRLGRCASDTTRKYTWERSGSDLAEIFNELLLRS
jgi:glycosyltransferase involved in cell wall biosynthesis